MRKLRFCIYLVTTISLIVLYVILSGSDIENAKSVGLAPGDALGAALGMVRDVALESIPSLQGNKILTIPTANLTTKPKRKPGRKSRTRKTNIVFILADDFGWNDIGYHGSPIQTPFMDNLALRGVRLENYYVQPVGSPTRASLMSGLYQSRTGINRTILPTERGCLPTHLPIIPGILRRLGYRTHLVGKWHLGMAKNDCLPLARGFDTAFGYYGDAEDYYAHTNQFAAKSGNFSVSGYDFHDNRRVAGEYKGQYSTHVFATRAEEIIAEHGLTKMPMFLFLSMQAVHNPLQAPKSYIQQNEAIKDRRRRMHAGIVTCMDEAIGNITWALTKHGLRNNSVIIFSSDNGGDVTWAASDNSPLRGNKKSWYEGGIRVVGFVNSPLLSPLTRGTKHKGLMGAADWYPTLVEGVVGGKIRGKHTDGYNMWEVLRTGDPSPRTEYLHYVDGDCKWNPTFPLQLKELNNVPLIGAIRVGPWKLHMNTQSGNAMSVHNIEKDPYEENNVLKSRQDVFKELVNRLKYHCRKHVEYLPCVEDEKSDPRKRNGVFEPWLEKWVGNGIVKQLNSTSN